MESEFAILIKYISHSLTETEKQVLERWRTLSVENEMLFSEVCKFKLLHEYEHHNTVSETALALNKVQSKIYRRTMKYRITSIMKYVAIVALFVSLSTLSWHFYTKEKYTTITVAENQNIKKVVLEDGTIIWLNSLSELQIPKSFSSSHRRVSIKGKAYFDVKKDSINPFFVTSKHVNLKVMGTSFDLSVNDRDMSVEAVLVSGKVVLQDRSNKDIIEMMPGEKVVYSAHDNNFKVSTVDATMLTSWHLDQIKFENATLREIVNKLSLIYDININLESKKIADRRYRYVINKEETLEEVLDILSYLAPIKYRIEGDEVFITQ